MEKVTDEPHVVALEEILNGVGTGWEENWIPADPEEGTESFKEISPCAWCYGTVAEMDDSVMHRGSLMRFYNRHEGTRIWSGRPSDELREATLWGD